jgi:hypothetical protein
MAQTLTKKREIITEAESNGWICADRSEIVHTFADGWTVRRLACAGDLRREGWIMRSCLAQYCGDELDDEPGRIKTCNGPGDAPFDWSAREWDEFDDLGGKHWGMCLSNLYSLRDEHNMPRATWWTRLGSYSHNLLGSHNEPVKKGYEKRVREWIKLVDAPMSSLGRIKLVVMDQGHRKLREHVRGRVLTGAEQTLVGACEKLLMVRVILLGQLDFDEEGVPDGWDEMDRIITGHFAKLGIDYTPWKLPDLDELIDADEMAEMAEVA